MPLKSQTNTLRLSKVNITYWDLKIQTHDPKTPKPQEVFLYASVFIILIFKHKRMEKRSNYHKEEESKVKTE